MEDKCIFIADKTIVNYLLSSEHEKKEKAEIFLDYLSWRKYNKKVYMTHANFDAVKRKFEEEEDKSLVAYFENWFEDGIELIGEDSTTEEEDTTSLYETLQKISPLVFIISDKSFKNLSVMNMEKLDTYLKDKKDFYKHIFLAYYDTSGV
jgi:hypothetical protein